MQHEDSVQPYTEDAQDPIFYLLRDSIQHRQYRRKYVRSHEVVEATSVVGSKDALQVRGSVTSFCKLEVKLV